MNQVVSFVRRHGYKAAVAMFGLSAVQSAMAAVDPAVTTAITDATADGGTIAGALLVFAISVGVVLYLKRKAG